jgi:hypothetical protein
MFNLVSPVMASCLKPLGLAAAIHLLNVFGVFSNIYNWFAFQADQLFAGVYAALTGQSSCWLFLEGNTMPVQMRYTRSMHRDGAKWFYMERTKQWVHRGTYFGASGNHFPFVTISLHTPSATYDMTQFFSEHRYYRPDGSYAVPSPKMLLNAWSIDSHLWFSGDELARSHLEIMALDCSDYTIGFTGDARQTEAYYNLFNHGLIDDGADNSYSSDSSGEEEGSEEEGSEEEGSEEEGSEEEGSEEEGSEEEGDDEASGNEEENKETASTPEEQTSESETSSESRHSTDSKEGEQTSSEEEQTPDAANTSQSSNSSE